MNATLVFSNASSLSICAKFKLAAVALTYNYLKHCVKLMKAVEVMSQWPI